MDTVPTGRVACCWGLFGLVGRSISPSWCESSRFGILEPVSPDSLPWVEAIGSRAVSISMMRREVGGRPRGTSGRPLL